MLEKSDQGAAGRHHDMAGAVEEGWSSCVLLLHKVLGVPVVEEHRWVLHHNLKIQIQQTNNKSKYSQSARSIRSVGPCPPSGFGIIIYLTHKIIYLN